MIYFVRHGESEANERKVFAGQRDDSLLTSNGREQAKATAQEIIKEGLKIDVIYSSPLKRAYETAEIIAKEIGFDVSKIIIEKRITEYDMGSLTGTPWHTISSSILVEAENAEDPKMFSNRVYTCISELSKSTKNILLSSHAGVGRVLETFKKSIDAKLFYDLPAYKNASITKIDWIK
ncbi:MAG: histidine phosphatase family protein [Candidatus Paceibacterota bacterium]